MTPTNAHGQCTMYLKNGLSNITANINLCFYSYVTNVLLYKSSTLYFSVNREPNPDYIVGPFVLSDNTKAIGVNCYLQ